MPGPAPVVVLGGYGTFGRIVSAELSRRTPVAVAGRSLARARALARSLGAGSEAVEVDLVDPPSLERALTGRRVAVNCAGPFQAFGSAPLAACLEAGCHSVDIADDRGWCARVRELSELFAARGLTAAYGCSSLPGISGALTRSLQEEGFSAVKARLTLFIGNKNPKGAGAVGSVVHVLGKPIALPQGTLAAFTGRERVEIPPPFGERAAWDFDSPEYDVFPSLLGIPEVRVKASFELGATGLLFELLARTGLPAGWLVPLARVTPPFGHSGAAVVAELWNERGERARGSISGADNGQRMAALPAVFAAQALLEGNGRPGAATAWELLGARALLTRLAGEGFRLEGPG